MRDAEGGDDGDEEVNVGGQVEKQRWALPTLGVLMASQTGAAGEDTGGVHSKPSPREMPSTLMNGNGGGFEVPHEDTTLRLSKYSFKSPDTKADHYQPFPGPDAIAPPLRVLLPASHLPPSPIPCSGPIPPQPGPPFVEKKNKLTLAPPPLSPAEENGVETSLLKKLPLKLTEEEDTQELQEDSQLNHKFPPAIHEIDMSIENILYDPEYGNFRSVKDKAF